MHALTKTRTSRISYQMLFRLVSDTFCNKLQQKRWTSMPSPDSFKYPLANHSGCQVRSDATPVARGRWKQQEGWTPLAITRFFKKVRPIGSGGALTRERMRRRQRNARLQTRVYKEICQEAGQR